MPERRSRNVSFLQLITKKRCDGATYEGKAKHFSGRRSPLIDRDPAMRSIFGNLMERPARYVTTLELRGW